MAGFSMEEHKQRHRQPGMLPGAPFTNMDYSMDKYLHWLYKVWDEIIFDSQTSTVQPLKFGNG